MADPVRFLLPDPPREPKLVKQLFVDRESEQSKALKQIEAVRKKQLGLPMALVGQARVGKSHLLRQIVGRIAKKFDVTVEVHLSTGLSDSRDVLAETLRQVYVHLFNAALEKGIGPAAGDGVLAPLENILNDYSEAIAGSAAEIEIGRIEKTTNVLRTYAGLAQKVPSLLTFLQGSELGPRLGMEKVRSESESEEKRVRVNRFEETHLTQLIGMAHALIREHAAKWRTLLVFDDFDLLKRDEEGNFDPDALLQALTILAEIAGFYVLTTVRQDTYRRHGKTFHRIVNVLPFVEEDQLIEIYKRHVKLYHEGSEPFNETFVQDVARLTNGRVGVFLQHLHEAVMSEEESDLPHLELRSWILKRYETSQRDEPLLAEILASAARDGGGILGPEELSRLRRSALIEWVLEDYTSETAARVDPVLESVLRDLERKQ